MVERTVETYEVNYDVVISMLVEPASPIYLISKIISENSNVLDIGVGSGLFARALKCRIKSVNLDGIEPN